MQELSAILPALINSVLVMVVVQLIKKWIPVINKKIPWLLPIIAGAAGPGIATLQTYLSTLLGVNIDLSPIAAIFTGGSAVALYQIGKQVSKGGQK